MAHPRTHALTRPPALFPCQDDDNLCQSCGTFANPRVIPSLPIVHSSSTSPWPNQDQEDDWCDIYSAARDLVFSYAATETVEATVSLCNSAFDTILKVREDGEGLVCNDDFCDYQSQLEVRPYRTVTTWRERNDTCV